MFDTNKNAPYKIAIAITRTNGIQTGLNTHHQLQVATSPAPANLSVIKIISKTAVKLKPVEFVSFAIAINIQNLF